MNDTVPRVGRRAAARQARRRRQLLLIGSALGALALLAVAFAVYLAVNAPEPPAATPGAARTQQTLSLSVRGEGGAGVANALLAHDPAASQGAVVLIPPQVLVAVPGMGSLPYGRAVATASSQASRGALSDLLGVTVDEGWTLDLPTFARLVDDLGGITVDVDAQVVQSGQVVLAPGRQKLAGAAGGVYLSYLAPGEQEQVRLARVQTVLDGLLDALPEGARLPEVLAGLGPRSTSTVPPAELASMLTGLAADDGAGQLQYDSLPVVDQDVGGDVVSFRADDTGVRRLADRLLAASVPPGARSGSNRFLVLNGVGTPGLGEAVRTRLVPQGLVFIRAQNAPAFGVQASQVLVPAASPDALALGRKVATSLKLPPASVRTQEFGSVADVVVLVGTDFRP